MGVMIQHTNSFICTFPSQTCDCVRDVQQWRTDGVVWGFQPPPRPRNSEDIGGVLDRISKKNRRLDFLM